MIRMILKIRVFTGTWGVSDEDLFAKANEVFKSHGEKPFFALMLTTSNHDPFEFPDGRIELYEQPKATRNNNVKYADFAVGKFFEHGQKGSLLQQHGLSHHCRSLYPHARPGPDTRLKNFISPASSLPRISSPAFLKKSPARST